jgi:hypothetical protein
MNNETLLLDSENSCNGAGACSTSLLGDSAEELNATNETSTDVPAVDCSNGACVLNWKPARSAA